MEVHKLRRQILLDLYISICKLLQSAGRLTHDKVAYPVKMADRFS